MLNEKQKKEILEHLETAQNPVFFYDNDADGLCSFILLRKHINRGRGVSVRSYPDLNESYAKKVSEFNADYVFVLDKPNISKKFFENIEKMNIPLVWIDHHDLEMPAYVKDFKGVYVYNPALNKEKSNEPVTYIVYNIIGKKEDLWIALIGCIADHYLPDFSEEFCRDYPDLWGNVKQPFDAYYRTEIGRIARALNFGLKDSTSNVVALQNFLINCKGPMDVLSDLSANKNFRKKYHQLKEKYDSLLKKALSNTKDKIIFFEYGGNVNMSSDIANEISYYYPDKYVVVVYRKGAIANISMRGKNVKNILEEILAKLEGSSGGGHEDAVGARIKTEQIRDFMNELKKILERKNG